MNDIAYYVLSAFAVLITLTIHEYSHGYAAYKLGDNTAKNMGRLTLNPIKHLDPIGALCMLFFRIGWAKPVPVNARNLKNPKRDFAIVALAGPLSNIVVSFFSCFLYLLFNSLFSRLLVNNDSKLILLLAQNTLTFFLIFHMINIGIALFNLIPIPPLDGSRVLGAFLSPRAYYKFMQHERTLYYALLGWLLLGDIASRFMLSIPAIASNPILSLLATFLSLSEILGYAIEAISSLMLKFWQLIPFLRF